MKRLSLIYGSISGLIIITSVIISMTVVDSTHLAGLEFLGYLIMLVALSVIFFGIRKYRDEELGGVIRFGTAVRLGLGISLVASAIHVGVWEVYLAATDYAFVEEYSESVLAGYEDDGLSDAEMAEETQKVAVAVERYSSPLFRMPITFLEIFPVGLLVTLISAGVLRRS